MVVVADAQVAIRGDLEGFKKDLAGAKTQSITLGAELRKALSFGPLAAQGPDALVAGLQRAQQEADDVNASIRRLAESGKLPAEDARRYADILDEIGVEADQTTAELKQLRAADPNFNTPAIQAAGDQIDRVGREAKGTAAELNAMKGVRADTHLERMAQQAREGARGLDATGKSAGGLIGKLNSVRGALVGLGLFIGAQQIVSGLRNFFGDAIDSASNLETATRGVQTVLGEASGTVIDFGQTSADSFGLSKREVAEFGAVLGGQLKAAGFDLQEAAEATVNLEQKAADLAATFGGKTSDAVTAIGALLRGERDTIEKYGVSIKEVDVKARIAALGLDTSTAAAEKNAVAVASLSLLYEQTSDVQGAFARNADTNAVIQAKAAAKMENATAKLGDALLPLVADITKLTADVLPPLIDGMLVVGGIFGRQADIIIPALALVLGVKLVAAFRAAQLAGTTSALAVKGAWLAALIAVPLILDENERVLVAGALAEVQLRHGAEAAKVFGDAMVETGNDVGKAEAALKSFLAGGVTVTEAWQQNMGGVPPIMDGVVATVLEGTGKIVSDIDKLPGEMADALLANQFHLDDAIDELIAFMDAALSPAEELFNARAFLASQAYRDGMNDGRPLVVKKTEEMRDEALAVIGRVAGFHKAGATIGKTWIDGIVAGIDAGKGNLINAADKVGNIIGKSLPTEGPLQHPDTGGFSIGQAWAKAIVPGIESGLGDLTGSLSNWASGLALSPMMAPMGGLATQGGAAGGPNITNYILHLTGVQYQFHKAADFIRALEALGGFEGDGSIGP